MKKIIEAQKMRSFMKKVDLEWEGKIRSYIFTDDDQVNVHLYSGIAPEEFACSLVPKAEMFVDFDTTLSLHIFDELFKTEILLPINS